jgi:hypothetical protein
MCLDVELAHGDRRGRANAAAIPSSEFAEAVATAAKRTCAEHPSTEHPSTEHLGAKVRWRAK